jgi:lysine-specific demethylase 3
MDMADAVNIMLYANEPSPGVTGCAVWDVYSADDSNAIREFLTDKYAKKYKFHDPIHAQIFYMNADVRRELYEKKGVTSSRIYQYPVRFAHPWPPDGLLQRWSLRFYRVKQFSFPPAVHTRYATLATASRLPAISLVPVSVPFT